MTIRRAVTIVELLVVLAILSILLGLLLPAVQAARERARETVCKNNLHQINLAVAQFTEAYKRIPDPGRPGFVGGWTIEILPFLEKKNLQQSIQPGTTISDAGESLLRPPRIFRCPTRSALDNIPHNTMFPAHYVLVPTRGRKGFLLFDSPIKLNKPWASGPEMNYGTVRHWVGPHHDGFFYAAGFQQGVDFMLNDEHVR
jgi:prepilin-type N-terminal cleavage/methylation domain-containing protein